MIVVASAGLNIPREIVEQYQIEETPQQIVIDGAMHDVRRVPSFAILDGWMRTATVSPYLLGTSTAEFRAQLDVLTQRTSEILVVTGTRKGLGTYNSAIDAADAIMREHPSITVRVVDTGLVEFGAGIMAAYAAACAHAGHTLDDIVESLTACSAASIQLFAPHSFKSIASGSASAKSVISSIAGNPPILHMKDGEVRTAGFFTTRAKAAATLSEIVKQQLAPGTAVWTAITYAGDKSHAEDLLAQTRAYLDVRYASVRHLGPGAYVVLGSKALGLSIHPVDAMPLHVELPITR